VSRAGPRKVPWGLLKAAFAALVLFLVARSVPWRDRLVLATPSGGLELSGRIEGDWTADAIAFAVDAEDRGRLPAELAADEAGRVSAVRGAGLTWQPGMPRVFGGLEAQDLALACALLAVGILFTSTRWWRLLAAAECPTSWWTAARLNVLGFFFNIVIPGLTGGDVVKAVMAAREHPERKAAAVVSIAVDRLLGLFVLALMAALVVLRLWDQMAAIRWPVLIGLAGGVLGALVYANRPLRRLVRFEHWIGRLPAGGLVKQLDEAVLIYSRHPLELLWAGLFSAGNHLAVFAAIFLLARSFGAADLSPFEGFAVVSIGNIVSALPVAPGGWGVGEAAYGYLFEMLGSSRTLGLATSITFRLALMAVGLLGGLLLLLPGGRETLAEAQSAEAGGP
jgi:uncharacterized protein (TIRG00374 family)